MLEYSDIRAILPQGAPMVLLDRVEWLVPGQRLRAVKTVSGSEPCYEHLPAGLPQARYAYPVSLILESFGQAAAVLWHSAAGQLADAEHVLMFGAARDCTFEGRAYPGDVLCHEVTLESRVADTAFATGTTSAGGRRIATMGSFIAVRRPVDVLHPASPSSSIAASSAR